MAEDVDAILCTVEELIVSRQWTLNRCRRHAMDDAFYCVTDADRRVLTPRHSPLRVGLGLLELLTWLEQSRDAVLSKQAGLLRQEIW